MLVTHPWPPIYDENSRVLILGTMPSPKSLEYGFYYGNPQNCFWRVLSNALSLAEPAPDRQSRTDFMLINGIALWDVLKSCEIEGASDGSIKNPVANDFSALLARSKIYKVFTTGKAATRLYNSLCYETTGLAAEYLPSTSPANRAAQGKPQFGARWGLVAAALYAAASGEDYRII